MKDLNYSSICSPLFHFPKYAIIFSHQNHKKTASYRSNMTCELIQEQQNLIMQ